MVKGFGLGKQLAKDFELTKFILGKGKKKKSAKQEYLERLEEIDKQKEELFFRMKLETLDKIEYKKDKFGKVKRKLRELLK